MSGTEEFLSKIHTLNGLKNAILTNIEIYKYKKKVCFYLVTDQTYMPGVTAEAENIAATFLPGSFSAVVKIEKKTPDEKMIQQEILHFMKNRFPAAAAFLEDKYIEVEKNDGGAIFRFVLASGEQALFTADNILDETAKYLRSIFCGSYFGDVRIVEKEHEKLEADVIEEADTIKTRYFAIENYAKIDGADPVPKYAAYMVDCNEVRENVALCGRLLALKERESKKGNKFYTVEFADPTGHMRGTYFPKKATEAKILSLQPDTSIVCVGDFEVYNNNLSFSIKKIDYGTPPENFVIEPIEGRKVPKAYHYVFPEKFEDFTQFDLFENSGVPDDMKEKTFVVFDLETTGLNNQPAVGKMDKIIEIGAVKMRGGNIVEKFSTFVACHEKLPSQIIELTGIHDADLVGAPEIEQAIADFYKFTDGCELVGHNVQFDYRFVRYYGEQYRYFFNAKLYDTVTIAQEVLRGEVSNYKLNTIADYYSIHFNHHRAFDDALTTAKIFIKLIQSRGGLKGL